MKRLIQAIAIVILCAAAIHAADYTRSSSNTLDTSVPGGDTYLESLQKNSNAIDDLYTGINDIDGTNLYRDSSKTLQVNGTALLDDYGIDSLSDVNATSPVDGELFAYNGTNSQWEPLDQSRITVGSATTSDNATTAVTSETALTATSASGLLVTASLSNGTASGSTVQLVSGGTLPMGAVCYIASNGTMALADADSNATMPVFAMALEALTDGDVGTFLLNGFVRNDDLAFSLGGGGAFIYASTTSGAISNDFPTGTGDQVQVLGQPFNATHIYFNPVPVTAEVG